MPATRLDIQQNRGGLWRGKHSISFIDAPGIYLTSGISGLDLLTLSFGTIRLADQHYCTYGLEHSSTHSSGTILKSLVRRFRVSGGASEDCV